MVRGLLLLVCLLGISRTSLAAPCTLTMDLDDTITYYGTSDINDPDGSSVGTAQW